MKFYVIGCITIIHTNVLPLGEEADFEAQNCPPALNLIRSTKLHLSTQPAFLPNACYMPLFLSFFVTYFVSSFFNYVVVAWFERLN
jgi:hypothetical protein